MASLTIRKLDDAIRDELRLRAARSGRSVEDEVRVILRDVAQNSSPLPAAAPQAVARRPTAHPVHGAAVTVTLPRVTLIIGGGIGSATFTSAVC
jgi:phosphopantothenoylcysteine decarboxylase/phosphopantothenate--cysteine ligase